MVKLDETDSCKGTAPQRRVPWFAAAIVAVCLLVLNARGVADPNSVDEILPDSGPIVKTCFYDHGWPMSWLKSQPLNVPDGIGLKELSFSPLTLGTVHDGWLFFVESKSIQWGAMLINLFLAIFLVNVVYVVCKKRLRKGFRFNLLEVGICVALASVAFAYYQYHRDISRKEKDMFQEYSLSNPAWAGPGWLRRLVGEPDWLGELCHFQTASISTSSLDATSTDTISRLPYLRELSIEGDPNRDQIELLGKLTQLEKIEVGYVWGFALPKEEIDGTETYESRIKKPNVSLPSIAELEIASKYDCDDWPRAVDLIDCCPNLKSVRLTGDQYLTDDLMNLPTTIEKIEYGFLSTDEEIAKLKKRYPGAIVEKKLSGGYLVSSNLVSWSIATTRINRLRRNSWRARFSQSELDFSFTEIDREFTEKLTPVFPETRKVIFGQFDSVETALWLTRQCPKLVNIDTNGFKLTYSEVTQLPNWINTLAIDQNSITAEEFVKLINQLRLRELEIVESEFDDVEMEKIRDASSSCDVYCERRP